MDIEKLIERLYKHHTDWGEGRTQDFFEVCLDCKDAATALSTLQTENEKLRAELERVKRERDAAIRGLRYLGDCVTCKYNKAPCPREDIGHKTCFQWRGQKED